jgi:hypothetical protein
LPWNGKPGPDQAPIVSRSLEPEELLAVVGSNADPLLAPSPNRALLLAAAADAGFPPRPVHQDAPHGFRRRAEMPPILPGTLLL